MNCVRCGQELSHGSVLSGDERCSLCWNLEKNEPTKTKTIPSGESVAPAPSEEAETVAFVARMRAYDSGGTPPAPTGDEPARVSESEMAASAQRIAKIANTSPASSMGGRMADYAGGAQ